MAKVYDKMQLGLCSVFGYADTSNKTIERVIRLPFSYHWKTGKAIPVRLFTYNPMDGLEEVKSVEDIIEPITTYNLAAINAITDNVKIAESAYSGNPTYGDLRLSTGMDRDVVNRLPCSTVIEKLYDFPKKMDDMTYRFKVSRERPTWIEFEVTNDKGKRVPALEKPDGYRINIEGNYIVNFSPNKNRPQGAVYPFLYHYFEQDTAKMCEWLESQFGIVLNDINKDSIMSPIKGARGTINFTSNGVVYKKEFIKNEKMVSMDSDLFRTPLLVK